MLLSNKSSHFHLGNGNDIEYKVLPGCDKTLDELPVNRSEKET